MAGDVINESERNTRKVSNSCSPPGRGKGWVRCHPQIHSNSEESGKCPREFISPHSPCAPALPRHSFAHESAPLA